MATPQLQISDFGLSLEPGPGGRPQPLVQSLQARLTAEGLLWAARRLAADGQLAQVLERMEDAARSLG
mgnify:CR=1 FL=1